jgi:hypothetical protein
MVKLEPGEGAYVLFYNPGNQTESIILTYLNGIGLKVSMCLLAALISMYYVFQI